MFNELRIRGFQVDIGILDKYSKDENQKTIKSTYEVDFVATKGSHKYYIQSAYRMDSPEKEAQETFSLRNIKDSFKKIVVVRDNIRPRRDESGILTIGIRQFLMDENAMDL
jgi:predicted AAA+ superfamily ATPase